MSKVYLPVKVGDELFVEMSLHRNLDISVSLFPSVLSILLPKERLCVPLSYFSIAPDFLFAYE